MSLPLTVRAWEGRLSEDLATRYGEGRDYFGVRELLFNDRPGGAVDIRVDWPADEAYYVDPRLSEGLAWWGGGTEPKSIPDQRRSCGRYGFSLLDAWTLWRWSRWLASPEGTKVDELTILHVDDHEDLGSPLLVSRGSAWTDALTEAPVNLRDPGSIEAAIRSGAIDVGSFFAPLLYGLPRVHIRHLRDSVSFTTQQTPQTLSASDTTDDLASPGAPRMAVSKAPLATVGTGHTYRVFDDADLWCADLPDAPVLLHVDMDFFNNRYDGDSDWEDRPSRHDPTQGSICSRITSIFEALSGLPLRLRPRDAAVALSPGFFPAEAWAPSVAHLESLLPSVLYHP